MSSTSDFIIENGILTKYVGPGGDVVIPEGVTIIGRGAFSQNSALTSVVIPEGVTGLYDWAFSACDSLKSVKIPESVTWINREAFDHCKSLKSVVIPKGVTRVGYRAFCGCRSLKSVTILQGETSIDSRAFWGCKKLTSIISNTKLPKNIFDADFSNPLITNDPSMLPANMKPLAAIGFAEHPDDPKSERGKKHLKYIKTNAAKLIKEALAHPALLRLMCENKLLTPEVTEAYLAAAQEVGNAEITAVLLDYQQKG